MVKRIEKTYSVKDGQVKKAVTFSTEEPLSSPSPVSYSSNTPVKYGFIDDGTGSGIMIGIGLGPGFGTLLIDDPFSSQFPVSYSSNTPVKYGFIDDTIRAVLDMIKGTGVDKLCGSCDWMKMIGMTSPKVDKLCGYCDLMKEVGLLDSSTAESGDKSGYTKVGYDGIYGGGYPVIAYTTAESTDAPVHYHSEVTFA